MAFPTLVTQQTLAIQQFANGLYDMQVGSETMDQVMADIQTVGGMDNAFNMYYVASFGTMDVQDVADMILANVGIVDGAFGLTAADVLAAKNNVAGALDAVDVDARGALVSDLLAGFATMTDDALFGEAAMAYNSEVANAVAYGGLHDVAPGTGAFTLTAGIDDIVGTAGDDYFDAPLSQNSQAGGVSNSLSSADSLDGGAGDDLLNAVLLPEFYGSDAAESNRVDVQPEIAGIETIQLEAKDDIQTGPNENDTIIFDAKDVTGVNTIGSYYSDGDLTIENLTTLTDAGAIRNTNEITITMDHTDNFNSDGDASDLTVYFDEDYLVSGELISNAALTLRMLNAFTNVTDGNPIEGFDTIRFTVGTTEVIVNVESIAADDTLDYTTAYDEVVDAINAELDAQGFTTVTAAKAAIEDAVFSIPVGDYDTRDSAGSYYPIILTNTGPEVLTGIAIEQAQLDYDTDMNNSFSTRAPTSSDIPLSINVELDKVGRSGDGGDLVIGGKDLGANGNGIPIFNVAVLGNNDEDSNLGVIRSTNDDLTTVNVTDHADWTGADLTVRDLLGNGQELTLIDATGFSGDFSLAMSGVTSQQALTSNFGVGNDRYDWMSSEADGVASGKNYSISMGDGIDNVTAMLDGDSVDAWGESFTLTTGNGNDTVTMTSLGGVSQNTMQLLDNLSISTGSGVDTVIINGYQNFDIEAGADNDFVYINSVGSAGADTGAWTFGTTSGPATFVDRVLYQADLTVTFAGFESTVKVVTNADGNFVADQVTINNAIKKAIADNDELNQLLRATSGTADQQLIVTSLVDGANELEIELFQPELVAAASAAGAGQVNLATADVTALLTGIIATNAAADSLTNPITYVNANDGNIGQTGAAGFNFLAPDFDGSADAVGVANVNYSVINMGSGANDLVVLDSNDDSANVLVIDDNFGKVSVVNFFDDAARTVVGNHLIDFTSYLNNQLDLSVNTPSNNLSAQAMDVTLNNDGTAEANSVTILGFDGTVANTVSWANLNATNLRAALNGDAGATVVGGIVDGTLNAVDTTANLVGNVQDHIVMVENQANLGEYKVFSLTSSAVNAAANNGDFTTADLLGTLDFGASINSPLLPLWGNDAAMDQYSALIDQADSGVIIPLDPTVDSLAAAAASVDEGATATFTVNTSNYADGSVLNYTIGGVDTADIVGGQLAGTTTVNANQATIDIGLVADATTEGAETMTVIVDGISDSIIVNDTSLTPDVIVPTDVTVADLQTYDASTDDFNFILDFTAAGVKLANINGFDAGDTVTVVNEPAGSTYAYDSSSADSLDFAYGDITGFSNAWAVQMGAQDAGLVTDVVAAADLAAQDAVLQAAWGDWLVA